MSKKIKDKMLFCLENNYNLLLKGKHGIGKTSMVLEAFKEKGVRYRYFSASTMDPWVDFIGVPKEKKEKNGDSYLDLIRPKDFQDDEIEAIFLDEFNRCLTGDTLIQLADGHSEKIKDLVGKKHFYVYSYDIEKSQVSIGKGHSARMTEKNAKILKITLDNGQVIECTKNHPFLTSDNGYVEAKNLSVNDSLMGLYKKYNKKSYELVSATRQLKWIPTYVLSDKYNIENDIYDQNPGEHRHHIDFNKFNNSPENIKRMSKIEHLKIHGADFKSTSEAGKKAHETHPDLYRKTIGTKESKTKALKNSIKTRQTSESYKKKRSEISKEMYTEEIREKRSEITKKQWESGQFKNINRHDLNKKAKTTYTIKKITQEIGEMHLNKKTYSLIQERIRNNGKGRGILSVKKIEEYFGNFENFVNHYYSIEKEQKNEVLNHRIVKIEDAGEKDVYDISVDKYHNFALGAGIFVHNSHPKIRNAVMELIQFKSINGKRFKSLKVVWAAINPDDDEDESYDVEPLDPAQQDRFEIQVELPYKPDKFYFNGKYGQKTADAAIEWWNDLSKEMKRMVSPRRLDMALDVHSNSGDIADVLPQQTNITKLKQNLNSGPVKEILEKIFKNKNEEEARKFINNENNFTDCQKYILKRAKYCDFFLPLMESEKIASLMSSENSVFSKIVNGSVSNSKFKDIVSNILESGQNKQLRRKIEKKLKLEPELKSLFYGKTAVNNAKFKQPGKKAKDSSFFESNILPYLKMMNVTGQTQTRINAYKEIDKYLPENLSVNSAREVLGILAECYKRSHSTTIDRKMENVIPIINTCIKTLMDNQKSIDFEDFLKDNKKDALVFSSIRRILSKAEKRNEEKRIYQPSKYQSEKSLNSSSNKKSLFEPILENQELIKDIDYDKESGSLEIGFE